MKELIPHSRKWDSSTCLRAVHRGPRDGDGWGQPIILWHKWKPFKLSCQKSPNERKLKFLHKRHAFTKWEFGFDMLSGAELDVVENIGHLFDKEGSKGAKHLWPKKKEWWMNSRSLTLSLSHFCWRVASNSKSSAPQSKSDLFISRDLKRDVSIQTSLSVKQQWNTSLSACTSFYMAGLGAAPLCMASMANMIWCGWWSAADPNMCNVDHFWGENHTIP